MINKIFSLAQGATAKSTALRAAVAYFLLGTIWILSSDFLSGAIFSVENQGLAQNIKGMIFIVLTSGLFGLLIYLFTRRTILGHDRQKEMLRDTVRALSIALEKRDPYTARHAVLVSRLAREIGNRMGLSADQLFNIELGALVHDIGKVGVPAEILVKPSKLTPIEFDLIRTHPAVGYEILSAIHFDSDIPNIVRDHHERLDGSGYPNGLKNDEISQAAQIVAVADVAESMSSHRPYRPALGLDATIQELSAEAGVRLNYEIVQACITVLHDPNFSLEIDPDSAEGKAINAMA